MFTSILQRQKSRLSNSRNVTQLRGCQAFCQGMMPRPMFLLFYRDSSWKLFLNIIKFHQKLHHYVLQCKYYRPDSHFNIYHY